MGDMSSGPSEDITRAVILWKTLKDEISGLKSFANSLNNSVYDLKTLIGKKDINKSVSGAVKEELNSILLCFLKLNDCILTINTNAGDMYEDSHVITKHFEKIQESYCTDKDIPNRTVLELKTEIELDNQKGSPFEIGDLSDNFRSFERGVHDAILESIQDFHDDDNDDPGSPLINSDFEDYKESKSNVQKNQVNVPKKRRSGRLKKQRICIKDVVSDTSDEDDGNEAKSKRKKKSRKQPHDDSVDNGFNVRDKIKKGKSKRKQKSPKKRQANVDGSDENYDPSINNSEADDSFDEYFKKVPRKRKQKNKQPGDSIEDGTNKGGNVGYTKGGKRKKNRRPVMCEYCGKICTQLQHLKDHHSVHMAEKPFLCPRCGKGFTLKNNLRKHIQRHDIPKVEPDPNIPKTYTCRTCKETFSERETLINHRKTHIDVNAFVCHLCGKKGFSSKYRLAGHIKSHNTIRQQHPCKECGKVFSSVTGLSIHSQKHTNKEPFSCEICGKKFYHAGILRSHVKIHSDLRPFICQQCGFTFRTKYGLTIHMRTHTGERPHKCELCSRAFGRLSNLTSHMKIHMGIKDFKCTVCESAFYEKPSLERHMRIHTGFKPYKCKFCDKAYNQSYCLTSHMKLHVGDKPYLCKVCNQAFSQRPILDNHLKTEHKVKSGAAVLNQGADC